MDSIFLLEEGDRIAFLFHRIMQSFGCTYICLWSYLPHPSKYALTSETLTICFFVWHYITLIDCLGFKCCYVSSYLVSVDGLFSGENSVARRLFEEYRHSSPLLFHEGYRNIWFSCRLQMNGSFVLCWSLCFLVGWFVFRRIPGYAFKNNLPYLELLFPALERLASNEVQKQFYRVINSSSILRFCNFFRPKNKNQFSVSISITMIMIKCFVFCGWCRKQE